MTLTNQGLMEQIRQNCSAQAEIVADCFNRALGFSASFSISEMSSWNPATLEPFWRESGMLVVLETDSGGVLVALPKSLPLPAWIHHPDESQASRMGTLGMEWSMSMMPDEFQGTGFSYHIVNNLTSAIDRGEVTEDAQLLKLNLDNSQQSIYVLGPIKHVALIADPVVAQPVHAATSTTTPQQTTPEQLEVYQRVQRIRRLIQLKVPVLVNLAEKKIQLKHLTAMSPGMLITFNKSCDDLLELYVNNQLFCRGEAVKIGENFGIKINEVGSQITEESGILTI